MKEARGKTLAFSLLREDERSVPNLVILHKYKEKIPNKFVQNNNSILPKFLAKSIDNPSLLWYNVYRKKEKERYNTMKMNRETIEREIERIENAIFAINMIDRWSNADRERLRTLEAELDKLNAELKGLEG